MPNDQLSTNVNCSLMESPDTLSQVINRLRQQGYSEDLNLHDNNTLWLDPDAYQVDEVFRFETVRRCGTR